MEMYLKNLSIDDIKIEIQILEYKIYLLGIKNEFKNGLRLLEIELERRSLNE